MADAFAKYRTQNGIDQAGSYDPQVVSWIRQAATEAGADPAALLATSLMESGAQRGRVGDRGTSFGPFQFHIGGALGSHSPQWANTYAAILDRAQQFARLGVHGGAGAAAVQRPADRVNYAAGVNDLLTRANAILGRTPAGSPSAPPGTLSAPQAQPQKALDYDPTAALDFVNALLGDASVSTLAQLGQKLGAQRAPGGVIAGPPPSTPRGSIQRQGGTGDPVTVRNPKLIGLPYQGTHTLYHNWESDNAIDIALPRGTPVYATTSGTIGSQIGAIGGNDPHMAGQRLHLDSGGQHFYYQHLQQIVVKAGQQVKKGQLLGYTGALNHLHFAVKNGDPRSYLK